MSTSTRGLGASGVMGTDDLIPVADFAERGGSPTVTVPSYNRSALSPGVAHIGVGNFHRVHQATYLEDLFHLRADQSCWGIVGIELLDDSLARSRAGAFYAQRNLYSFTAFSPEGQQTARVNGSMIDYLHAPQDRTAVVRALSDGAVRVVTMTITEGGYNLDERTGEFDLSAPDIAADLRAETPKTAFGVLTAALRNRRKAGVAPFTVVSCDNLRHNGDTARKATVGFAAATDPTFADWIDGNVAFPNSMVDRIAPTVGPTVRRWLNNITGIDDRAPVTSETFRQWVLEDIFPTGRPAWEDVGVEIRGDVAAFEALKGRLINASHMLLAYPAALLGYERVAEAATDPLIAELLDYFTAHDAAPTLTAPGDISLEQYRKQIVPRFANANVPDTVLRVAHDGGAKLPIFHRATAERLMEMRRDMRRPALLLAAFRAYLGGVNEKGASFEVFEPHLSPSDWSMLRSNEPLDALEATPFSSWGLAKSSDFITSYLAAVETLECKGVHVAIRQALGR